ncbi:HTH domain-containing protein [Salinibaculum salinum]|uniref:HTH domain-containing protein n=1 Tax=Salinibaculum salinum TaxID=3131996 RepID=UPI0030EEEB68
MNPLQLQVCLRPFTPAEVQERQQEVLDRLAILENDGVVDVEVVWWSPRVCPPHSAGPLSGGCPDVVCELVELAERDGFSLEPFIEEHPGAMPGQGDSLTLPVVSLVARDEGEIAGIYPITLEGTAYTVEDGLRILEAGESILNLKESVSAQQPR